MWQWSKSKKLRSRPVSPEWRRLMEAQCPFLQRLPVADQRELEGYVQVFMAEKRFEGCGGLVMNDDIRLCIAGHAGLLLVHRETGCYPSLRSVLVYPKAYVVPTTRHVGGGVLEEFHQQRAGESWHEGAVVLAWEVICRNVWEPESGFNVILHEFAHQLDYEDGVVNGAPLLGHGEPREIRRRRYADWQRVMRAEYEQLQAKVQRGESTVLDQYGATNPAEFFAVATECFFGKPQAMQQLHPQLYDELKWYYRQDPARWSGVGQGIIVN